MSFVTEGRVVTKANLNNLWLWMYRIRAVEIQQHKASKDFRIEQVTLRRSRFIMCVCGLSTATNSYAHLSVSIREGHINYSLYALIVYAWAYITGCPNKSFYGPSFVFLWVEVCSCISNTGNTTYYKNTFSLEITGQNVHTLKLLTYMYNESTIPLPNTH